ncbi:MAG: LysM peptidoglycan-binding domain-containing protein [Chloroflexi bacterium]|nr:LysM peptidoglycan-binding domain-containing protein [Chloroflexota bacterium]
MRRWDVETRVRRSRLRWLALVLAALFSLGGAVAVQADLGQAPSVAAQCRRVYVVRQGDVLSQIAARFRVSVRSLARANSIRNVNRIYVGQRLCIPGKKKARPKPTPTPKPWPPPAAAIEVFSPVAEGVYHSPIEIIGFSRTFEGAVNIRLKDAETGEVLAERIAAGGGVKYDFFHTYIRFETLQEGESSAVLELFEIDARSGAEINKVIIPIVLIPGQRMLDVFTPRVGQKWRPTGKVSGYSWTFEGGVVIDLQDRNGSLLQQTTSIGGAIMYDLFSADFEFAPSSPTPALISVYGVSPRDGRRIDETRIPVTLLP